MPRPTPSPIPVTLLTGFLGSGKTTLLNHWVRQPAMARTLVIINEFGEIGLDHRLVSVTDETEVVALDSGCVCCTIRGDLVRTLRDAPWRYAREGKRQFDRLVIETTGLADPAPILHTLMTDSAIVERYRLDGIIGVIDGVNGEATLDCHSEAVKQAAVADLVLITKPDLTETAALESLQARLEAINPGARQQVVTHGEIDAGSLTGLGLMSTDGTRTNLHRWLQAHSTPPAMNGLSFNVFPGNAAPGNAAPENTAPGRTASLTTDASVSGGPDRHDDHIRAHCFTLEVPIELGRFEAWIELMIALMGENMLRIKGVLNIAGRDRPVVIHGVQHIFHPPLELESWPDSDRRSQLVFITRDIPRESLESLMMAVM